MSTDESDKDFFKKSDNIKSVSTNGAAAHVLFINKKPQKRSKSEYLDENVTDGGLKEKDMKYYNMTKVNNFVTKSSTYN